MDRGRRIVLTLSGTVAAATLTIPAAADPCEEATSFETNQWTLVELGGKPVDPAGLPREPYLEFLAEPRRVVGSGGCNRLTGEYHRDGERLSFKPLASTRMACVNGMDIEASFFAALDKVRAFRITGRRLELLGEGGETLAALKAAAAQP
jgi:heat shock protein HslJ